MNSFLQFWQFLVSCCIITLDSRFRGNDNKVVISISDTGCGIETNKLVTIFDPFYSTKDSGTGLGLPITHGIIKDHGGEIKVESTVGSGTTFTLILPSNSKL